MDELETQEEAERTRREAAEAEAKVWRFILIWSKKYSRFSFQNVIVIELSRLDQKSVQILGPCFRVYRGFIHNDLFAQKNDSC